MLTYLPTLYVGGRQSIKKRLKVRQRIAINKAARKVKATDMTGETDMTGIHQDDQEESSHNTEHEDTRANAEIVKTINTLPDNHYAWGYQDPTKAYYVFSPESKVNKGRTDFINWYDMQIHNMAEIKATQFLMNYYDGLTTVTGDSKLED